MAAAEKRLNEVALRVRDLESMHDFYVRTVGLELFRAFDRVVLLRCGLVTGNPPQLLALFHESRVSNYPQPAWGRPDKGSSVLHHLAFAMSASVFAAEEARLEGLGVPLERADHTWIGWRSLYFQDPEENVVEFVTTS